MRRVIDFHIHVGDLMMLRNDIQNLLYTHKKRQDFDIEVLFNEPKELVKYIQEQGVYKGVILAEEGPGTNFHITTEFIADYYKRGESDVLIPFGCINPNTTEDVVAAYKKAIKMGIKGFKLYPADHDFNPNSKELFEVYRLMEEDELPLMFHTGSTAQVDGNSEYCAPLIFEPILKKFPKLNVVFAHSGRPNHYREAEMLTRKYENCYLETALVRPKDFVKNFPNVEEFSEKIIFGSDWPGVMSLSTLIKDYEECGLSEEALDNLFYRNAAKLLKLVQTESVK
ncbi:MULTISPECIES: amidohydrolase family protein [unclassified Bacillus cereus group]|uniref:amidohydrolase family protein n=1 Tax=unclassified Bacillus cereus group TaxID=2750818 RepID=UPI001F5A23A8|nr:MULTISPECIES: amidohydrolase family protein [unclassified Bacillus cereus group]